MLQIFDSALNYDINRATQGWKTVGLFSDACRGLYGETAGKSLAVFQFTGMPKADKPQEFEG
jgi:hypothetical protein